MKEMEQHALLIENVMFLKGHPYFALSPLMN